MKKTLNIKKNQKGAAITTLVLATVLAFFIILTGIFVTTSSLRKSQLESDIRIQELYMADVDNVDEIYKDLVKPYAHPYIPTGFTYIEGTWNDGYVIQDGIGNEFVWVPCVLNQNEIRKGDAVVTFEKTLPTTTANTDPLYAYNKLNLGLLPTDATVTEEDSSVAEIRTSVGKYQGFYIARYEAGVPGTTVSTLTEDANKQTVDGTQKPTSKAGVGVWNWISRANAITVSKTMIDTTSTGVKSTLISGECWDTTLQWMIKTSANKATNVGYDINSTGKGWYEDISSYTIHTTGYYAVNRIYDMAGNAWEFTTENCIYSNSSYVVSRGGNFGDSGSNYPAVSRYYRDETVPNAYNSFRVVLYK